MAIQPTSIAALAQQLDAHVQGDARAVIQGVASLDAAGPGDLTFLANPRYAKLLAHTRATAVIVGSTAPAAPAGVTLLRVEQPYLAWARALTLLVPVVRPESGVHPGAHVHPSAQVLYGATVMAGAYVGAEARIGAGSVLYPNVTVLERCHVGSDCLLYPGVVLREDCVLGDRVILHNNVSIGADGYGFAQDDHVHVKIPQLGNVVVEDDVELGACTCVDRAALGSTRIGEGTKVDDLVMIGHGCQVGAHCLIVAQSGMAGSATVGERSTLGARAGVLGHLSLGPGTVVYSRAHVTKSTPPGAVVSGNPARPHRQQLRQEATLAHLEGLLKRVSALEKSQAARQDGQGTPRAAAQARPVARGPSAPPVRRSRTGRAPAAKSVAKAGAGGNKASTRSAGRRAPAPRKG